jgi:hypothetical protein
MFLLKMDVSAFQREADWLKGAQDQVPYALSLALNEAVAKTREHLITIWPHRVNARNKSFIHYALRRGPRATKTNLRVEIYDQTGKAFMARLEHGGTHQARGSNLAIPSGNVRIGAKGVSDRQKPRNLVNAFVSNKNGRAAIYQRVGKGKKQRIKLMYLLKPSVQVPKKLSFHEDFVISMREEAMRSFAPAMAKAMRTRR